MAWGRQSVGGEPGGGGQQQPVHPRAAAFDSHGRGGRVPKRAEWLRGNADHRCLVFTCRRRRAAAPGQDRHVAERIQAAHERCDESALARQCSGVFKADQIGRWKAKVRERAAGDGPGLKAVSQTRGRADRALSAGCCQWLPQPLPNERRHLLDGYRFVELARKVVGVGSVGTWAWILLFVGRDEFDPLVLQAKEAEESVLEAFAGSSQFKDHGERVVSGQRLMQAVSDIFLGWQRMRGPDGREHHYYVRQFRAWQWTPDVTTLSASALKI